jgi:hypothetical protein
LDFRARGHSPARALGRDDAPDILIVVSSHVNYINLRTARVAYLAGTTPLRLVRLLEAFFRDLDLRRLAPTTTSPCHADPRVHDGAGVQASRSDATRQDVNATEMLARSMRELARKFGEGNGRSRHRRGHRRRSPPRRERKIDVPRSTTRARRFLLAEPGIGSSTREPSSSRITRRRAAVRCRSQTWYAERSPDLQFALKRIG